MINLVALAGRWTKDPDVRYTQGDTPMAIARGHIAVDRRGKDAGTDFISVVAFGKTAEHIQKYYKKGMKADITGRIQTGNYTNKDGNKVYTTDVVIDQISFGESKRSETETTDEGFVNVPDEIESELPFN